MRRLIRSRTEILATKGRRCEGGQLGTGVLSPLLSPAPVFSVGVSDAG
jgi:hypothetical protein